MIYAPKLKDLTFARILLIQAGTLYKFPPRKF